MKWYLLVAGLTFGLVLAAIGLSIWQGDTLAAWLEALATLAAFTAAGFAVIQVSRTLALERRRDEERAEEKRKAEMDRQREQARLVYAVPIGEPALIVEGTSVERDPLAEWEFAPGGLFLRPEPLPWRVASRDLAEQKVEIGNLSNELISNVYVHLVVGGESVGGSFILTHLRPGERKALSLFTEPHPKPEDPSVIYTSYIRLSFEDSGGKEWYREGYESVRDNMLQIGPGVSRWE